jgi:hypothetical protein
MPYVDLAFRLPASKVLVTELETKRSHEETV